VSVYVPLFGPGPFCAWLPRVLLGPALSSPSVWWGLTDCVFVASSRARLRLDSGRFFAGLDSGRPLFLDLLFLFFSLTKDLLFLFFSLTNLAYSRVNHVFFP
jgi:hypothetical protein